MTGQKHDTYADLRDWLSDAEKVVVAGIGNPIRSDDFVGVKIVHSLLGKVTDRVFLIECETVPEDFIQQILDFDPTHVLLIDAALLGLKPGESKLVDPGRLTNSPAFSTHMLPLWMFCDYIKRAGRAKIGLVLIEPGKTDFGERLTPKVEASAKTLINMLLKTLP